MFASNKIARTVNVVIAGGGIAGSTLANLLSRSGRNVKFNIKVVESRFPSHRHGIGGGIGLWSPSQSVLKQIPGYSELIQRHGALMPAASYRDPQGNILAQTHTDFPQKFPVQCLDRHELQQFLQQGLRQADNVEIIYGKKIANYLRQGNQLIVQTDQGDEYPADLLVGADGIHSTVRNILMAELNLPPIHPIDLGYTYFRANLKLPTDGSHAWWSAAFETWGMAKTKHGTYPIRFGYVPLKPPYAFWFIAVKTEPGHPFLSPCDGSTPVDEPTKTFLTSLIESWQPVRNAQGEIAVDYRELLNSTDKILRTDIAKIANVTNFPWHSQDGRVILLGDAPHATAPNIAQGAGLSIEDAAALAQVLDRPDFTAGISEYAKARKKRAHNVQGHADRVAALGQLENPILIALRNGFMRFAAKYLPKIQKNIFDAAVAHSLGGTLKFPYWHSPRLEGLPPPAETSLLGRTLPQPDELPNPMRAFKTAPHGGSGHGVVTVKKPPVIGKLLEFILGLPRDMTGQPFSAQVTSVNPETQLYTRVFGNNTPQQKTYTTKISTHASLLHQKRFLSETLGIGRLPEIFKFLYETDYQNGSLTFQSRGLSFLDLFQLPIPNALLPLSEWVERPMPDGWTFQGSISAPLLHQCKLIKYEGDFQADPIAQPNNNRLIVVGGSGMIGQEVCRSFIQKGFDVYCLSRSANTPLHITGVKVRASDSDWSDLIDENTTILNLGGSNPGAQRWTEATKSDIAQSRYKLIDIIKDNIKRAKTPPKKYLQASAVGIYGDAGSRILNEHSQPVIPANQPGTKFRVAVCQEIEKRANEANCDVINLRIGHVLSDAGGLLPYCKLAGFFGAGRFGSGQQYVPFIHIKDLIRAIDFIVADPKLKSGAINLVAPKACTNEEMLSELRLSKWLPGIPLPDAVLQNLIGESYAVLSDSERATPEKLQQEGFKFQYPTITSALHGLK